MVKSFTLFLYNPKWNTCSVDTLIEKLELEGSCQDPRGSLGSVLIYLFRIEEVVEIWIKMKGIHSENQTVELLYGFRHWRLNVCFFFLFSNFMKLQRICSEQERGTFLSHVIEHIPVSLVY